MPFVSHSSWFLSLLLGQVAQNRGVKLEDKKVLFCGDSVKGFFKLVWALYSEDAQPTVKKSSRSRDDGVCGAEMSDTGQNTTLLLAVVSFCSELH